MRSIALTLTVLTGFSGLVYEVTWEKLLATLLGSHSEATASVLGLFLGGLAVGYTLFGRFTQRRLAHAARSGRPARLLFSYGLLEASIGVYALLTPLLFQAIQALSFAIPHGGGGFGFALDVALSALLIGPPAVLMGGTIPILTQALAQSLGDATRVHAQIYAYNTAGAFLGALSAGFFILPRFGLVASLVAMGCVNLLAGSCFLLLGRRSDGAAANVAPGVPAAPQKVPGFAAYALVALFVGASMMTLQTVLIRLGSLTFGSSQFTFSMVVSVFVLCIALGSLGVSALRRIPRWLLALDVWLLVASLLLIYAFLPDAPYWAHRLRVLFPQDPAAFHLYYLAACGGILATVGIPIVLSGATLPLIFDQLRNQVAELGDTAGSLYSANTLGSLLGALLGGYALLFFLDLHQVFRLAVGLLTLAAAIVTLKTLPALRSAALILTASALVVTLVLPDWSTAKLSSGLFRFRAERPDTYLSFESFIARRLTTFSEVFYQDGPMLSVAVLDVAPTREGEPASHSLWSNGKPEGSVLGDFATTAMLGLVPVALSKNAESAFVIGYGTGATVGSLASLDSMKRITVAEVSPSVMAAAPYFEDQNGAPLEFPGLEILTQDAYRALMRSDERYDVIVSEPSNPWVLGVEMLYTPAFLEAAKAQLAPGGVHCQWFHIYEADQATIRMVLRSYASVFDRIAVWYGRGTDMLLLGFADAEVEIDLDALAARVEQPDFAAALSRADVESFEEFLSHELLPLGLVNAMDHSGPSHSLLHPRLNDVAARAFFVGELGKLPEIRTLKEREIGDRNSLMQRYIAANGGELRPGELKRVADELCVHLDEQCVALLAHWTSVAPHSQVRARIEHIVRTNPAVAFHVPIDELEAVTALYTGLPADAPAPTAAEVEQAVARYARFYSFVVPFPRDAIEELLTRCESNPLERPHCEALRARLLTGDPPFDLTSPTALAGGSR